MSQKCIYLDHAATTPADPRVMERMSPYFTDVFANPSSLHAPGLRAKEAVMAARESIAKHLNAHADEMIFTSGGTESDNLAIVGTIGAKSHEYKSPPCQRGLGDLKPHVITSAIEHHAVLEPLIHLEKTGEIDLTVVPVDADGIVDADEVAAAIRPGTVLVSIMLANNEIGTIQPIGDIGRAILKWRKAHATPTPYFHTDACQTAGVLDLDVEKMHVDFLTLNGGKIYGPKGVGLLFIRRGVEIDPMIRGGGQERNLRSGTENVPGIVGLAAALDIAQEEKDAENARLTGLRDYLIDGLLRIPKSRLNGHSTKRLPNNVNVTFLDIEGEAAALYLDAQGICVSTGSACASRSLEPSHVIRALGVSYEAAHGSLRFTLGRKTTREEIDFVLSVVPGVIEKLRHMSPVNLDVSYFK